MNTLRYFSIGWHTHPTFLLRIGMRNLLLLLGLLSVVPAYSYSVKGQLKGVQRCWYPTVYLSAIENIDDLYAASYRNVLQSAPIDSAGNFELKGTDLPDDVRFYRLYVTPDASINTQISTGQKRNYVLLALTNKSEVQVSTADFCAPYFTYAVTGSTDNIEIERIQEWLDSFRQQYTDTAGVVKKSFLEQRLQQDLLMYADTSTSLPAALLAILETDPEKSYSEATSSYQTFAERYAAAFPTGPYTKQLKEKLLVLGLKEDVAKGHSRSRYLYLLLALLGISIAGNVYLLMRKRKEDPLPAQEQTEYQIQQLIKELTIKEREILLLIDTGLSNKEIADKLNVEVSTIKTHVSRIYQKVNIKNRKEVREIARYLS